MATATERSRAAKQLARRAQNLRVPPPMAFRIYEENSGSYHWRILADDGETLARSGGFGSYDGAEQAAMAVHAAATSALLERSTGDAHPIDLAARRDASDDNSDPERWLDEGGSFRSEVEAE